MPIMSNSVVTRVLTPTELDAIGIRTGAPLTDTRTLRHYYRLLPDNRLQIGSRAAITGKDAEAALGKARYRLSKTDIAAPVDGRIAPFTRRRGDSLAAGDEVMAIVTAERFLPDPFAEAPGQRADQVVDERSLARAQKAAEHRQRDDQRSGRAESA